MYAYQSARPVTATPPTFTPTSGMGLFDSGLFDFANYGFAEWAIVAVGGYLLVDLFFKGRKGFNLFQSARSSRASAPVRRAARARKVADLQYQLARAQQ